MKDTTSINNYADIMAMRFWLRLSSEIEKRGMSFRKLGTMSGVDHTLISEQVRVTREGHVPRDTRLEIIDRLCMALGLPLSFFLCE